MKQRCDVCWDHVIKFTAIIFHLMSVIFKKNIEKKLPTMIPPVVIEVQKLKDVRCNKKTFYIPLIFIELIDASLHFCAL